MSQMNKRIKQEQQQDEDKSVVVIEWIDPIFLGGNWMPELIQNAGGVSLLAKPNQHSTVVTCDEIMKANPNYVIVAPW